MRVEQTPALPNITIVLTDEEARKLATLLSKYEGSEFCIIPGHGGVLVKQIRVALGEKVVE